MNFADRLSTLEDPIFAVGTMYAFYGTILSGGQSVKAGVQPAFIQRLDVTIAEYVEDAAQGTLLQDDVENTRLKARIAHDMQTNPMKRAEYITKSVSFFSFDDPDFHPLNFKIQHWHPALNRVAEHLELKEQDKAPFATRLVTEARAGVQVVLDSITSFLEALKRNEI
ncbi:MAG: hypothetical protein JSR97_03420 [Verrucomicrobia bacterium]|nr:hypothetical protein [Verrucomicrobiota bacterium]